MKNPFAFFRSRDKPRNYLNGSYYSFLFGTSTSGNVVNERSAMQLSAVYACVRILAEAVAQIGNYDNGPGAIGYSYLYYVNTLVENSGIKVLAIDGVAPTAENLQSGAYPFTVNYYAVYVAGNERAERFVDWLVSPEGQACVAQAGYVPLKPVD